MANTPTRRPRTSQHIRTAPSAYTRQSRSRNSRQGSYRSPRYNASPRVQQPMRQTRSNGFVSSIRAAYPRAFMIACLVAALLAVLLVFRGCDAITHNGRIYDNVSVAGIAVGGMTTEEAASTLSATYEALLNKAPVFIYSNEQALAQHLRNEQTADEASVEQENAKTVVWDIDATQLQATIDYPALANLAFNQGRGGLADRLSLMFGSRDVPLNLALNEAAVDGLGANIDGTLGEPYVDYGIEVTDGVAAVTEGHDGMMVDREWLANQLKQQLLSASDEERSFVASVQYAPVQISRESAAATADAINAAISRGVAFSCEDETWTVDADRLGSLVITQPEWRNDAWLLAPHIDDNKARHEILTYVGASVAEDAHITFSKDESGNITVTTDSSGEMPQTSDAAESLDKILFANYRETGQISATSEAPVITVGMTNAPMQMSFEDALSFGIIGLIDTYTTEYTSGATARNVNIHLASDKLNNSIIPANGARWSFNETLGETKAEDGFQVAGVVVGNDTDEDVGGGICQVATTIFNAVYDAGYPILARSNHSIYMPAYPEGRDAAVSWEYPDLVWQNDSSSDILMCLSYTDGTVTVDLYGIDPGYVVKSDVGEWEIGNDFQVRYEVDDSLGAGASYVKSEGVKGRSISITRYVYDKDGTMINMDTFESNYRAQDRVIVTGSDGEGSDSYYEEQDEDSEYEDDDYE